jgi:hypothetical protein
VPLDFEEIRRNALADDIGLDEIRILFEGLDESVVKHLSENGVTVLDLGGGKVITSMLSSEYDYLQNMATDVLKLSAD